jgi:hypothetical protein
VKVSPGDLKFAKGVGLAVFGRGSPSPACWPLVVALVLLTVLLRRHRNWLIERTVNDRLAQK